MFPVSFGTIGDSEELIEAGVGYDLCVEPRSGHTAQLKFSSYDHAGKAKPADGRGEPFRSLTWGAFEYASVRAHQCKLANVVTE
ncbi:hypothetical protein D9M72_344760 [compost metagenome]